MSTEYPDTGGGTAVDTAAPSNATGDDAAEPRPVISEKLDETPPPHNKRIRLYLDWESLKSKDSKESILEEDRDEWQNPIDFIMSCLSFSVGLGNVWRFPFVAYANGGGAFLLPYCIMLVILGIPMYFLELSIGQFCSRGPISMWNMAPIFRGVGWAFLFINICTCLYYIAILAVCVVYFFHGLSSELPWQNCYFQDGKSEWYATEGREIFKTLECKKGQSYGVYNKSTGDQHRISNAELFYQYGVMKQADQITDGLGTPDLTMSLATYLVWLLIFFYTMLGTKSAGKMAYFTALFPYVVLIIMFVKAVTLPGSMVGIQYFFHADWSKIGSMKVWLRALCQVFFSLGVGYGVLTQFGSHSPVHKKCYRDAIFVGVTDTLTSILAGMTSFGVLGVLSKMKNLPIEKVTTGGFGLAFVSYPELIVLFKGKGIPQLFSALFFLMLFTLGLGTGAAYVQSICGTFFDKIPFLSKRRSYKVGFTAFVCFLFATCGLIFATPGGSYMVEFFDVYSSGMVVFAVVIFQMAGIAYIYGMKNYVRDLQFMFPTTSKFSSIVFKCYLIWGYSMPVMLTIVLAYIMILAIPIRTHDGNAVPSVLTSAGWTLFWGIVSIIPFGAIFIYFTRRSTMPYKKFLAAVTANHKWGPKCRGSKEAWLNWKRGYDGTSAIWKLTFGRVFESQWKLQQEKSQKPEIETVKDLPSVMKETDFSKDEEIKSQLVDGDGGPSN